MSSRQKPSSKQKSSSQRKAGKATGAKRTNVDASRRPPTASRRTGARPTDDRAKGKREKPTSKRRKRPSLEGAREYAYRPYVDQFVASPPKARSAAPGATGDGTTHAGDEGGQPVSAREARKDARRAARNRRKENLNHPGITAMIRGGWPGFLILLFGEFAVIPFGAGILLYWVALIAYAVAGNRGGSPSGRDTKRAVRDGALAAVFAFALTIPLRLTADIHNTLLRPWPLFVQAVAGLVVGGLAGLIVSRAHRRVGQAAPTDA